MKLGLFLVAVLLSGCAALDPFPVNHAYVWPTKGQGTDQTAKDKVECYRIAQGLTPEVVQAEGSHAAFDAAVDGTVFLGAVGGFAGGAAAYEQELARRYPPDLKKYGSCLVARGYSVDWPNGRQP